MTPLSTSARYLRPLSVAILAPLYTHHPMTAPIPEVRLRLGLPSCLLLDSD